LRIRRGTSRKFPVLLTARANADSSKPERAESEAKLEVGIIRQCRKTESFRKIENSSSTSNNPMNANVTAYAPESLQLEKDEREAELQAKLLSAPG
jgi:hypothetical protein